MYTSIACESTGRGTSSLRSWTLTRYGATCSRGTWLFAACRDWCKPAAPAPLLPANITSGTHRAKDAKDSGARGERGAKTVAEIPTDVPAAPAVQFLVLQDKSIPSVPHLLREMMSQRPIGGLAVHWRVFGSSGHIEPPEDGVLQARLFRGPSCDTSKNSATLMSSMAAHWHVVGSCGHIEPPEQGILQVRPSVVWLRCECTVRHKQTLSNLKRGLAAHWGVFCSSGHVKPP